MGIRCGERRKEGRKEEFETWLKRGGAWEELEVGEGRGEGENKALLYRAPQSP